MKKLGRFLVLVLLCGMLVLLSGFLVLGMYYRNNFPVNTWINGVYCTGKTIEQVNSELVAQTKVTDVVITDAEGKEWHIASDILELHPDYTAALKAYMRKNATVLWMQNMQKPSSVSLEPTQYRWNAEKLEEQIKEFDFVRQESIREEGCVIRFDEEAGYYLYDGNKLRLNIAKTLECIKTCLYKGELSVNLVGGNCYEDREDDREDASQRALWGQLQDYFDCGITYDMGAEKIPLTPAILSSFLKADENRTLLLDKMGQIIIDKELVEQWVEELAARYNTCGTEREFRSTRGDVILVKYSTYGTKLDTKAEKKYLVTALTEKRTEQESHIPAYIQEGFVRGLDDIGDTYIEVDMTEQHMYYYVDGELRLETDVVTGNISRRRGTPEGINFVYNKQTNRILRGADYATPVKYWMPVKGAIGIHDADWRNEFGGEIYKKNGSHGCVNIPPSVMAELYEMVEIGTPVVMFY